MVSTIIIWSIALLIYGLFWFWYVGFQTPVSLKEIDHYMNKFAQYETDPAITDQFRRFLEKDTGKSFVMINNIKTFARPKLIEGIADNATSFDVLKAYSKPFASLILQRAGHPILQGKAAMKTVDSWGTEGADEWTYAGLVRYRSRRDLMEIITNPLFHEKHEFKYAALEKSIAYPIDPWFMVGGPKLTVFLAIALLASMFQLFLV